MDDISSAVSKLLQDGQAISYIQELLGGSEKDNSRTSEQKNSENSSSNLDLGALAAATQLFSGGNSECEKLLDALLPFLSEKRKKKASDAKRILKILALLPVLKESGLLENFLGSSSE